MASFINHLPLLLSLVLNLISPIIKGENHARSSHKITLLTYNVNFGRTNQLAVAIIDTLDADIVCLQETTPDWEKLIRENLSDKYSHIMFKHCCRAGGLAVLSKFPVKTDTYISNEVGWFPGWLLLFETPLGEIQVLNLHLKPGINDKGKAGFLALEFFKAQKLHIKELTLFMKHLKPGTPTLLLGDLNENDNSKAIKWLRKKMGYTDALRLFDKHSRTWEWGILRGRYDHILFDNSLKCTFAKVYHQGVSDHFPVVGSFQKNTPSD